MRNALLAVAAVVVVFLAGWIVDDKILGGDIPRGESIAGVDVGKLDIDEARERIAEAGLTDRDIQIFSGDTDLVASAADYGVTVELDAALDAATDRPSLPMQPLAWVASLFSGDDHDPSYSIDEATLGTLLAAQGDVFFALDFGLPEIELVDGEFVEVDAQARPVVDLPELADRILAASLSSNDVPAVEIPIGGSEGIDRGADALIAEANELTANGISLKVTGGIFQRRISQTALRSWIVFGGTPDDPTISLNENLVQGLSLIHISEPTRPLDISYAVFC